MTVLAYQNFSNSSAETRRLLPSEILDVWERGLGHSITQQALLLLAMMCPDTPLDGLAQLSIGERDARLLRLRERLFGPHLEGIIGCPKCCKQLELTFYVSDVYASGISQVAPYPLDIDGYDICFRLPTSEDLLAVMQAQDVEAMRGLLLARCAVEVRHNGVELSVDELPATIVGTLIEMMAQADPQTDVQLNVLCPTCRHNWLATFDIASFLWSEI